jgi:hypothetical protein
MSAQDLSTLLASAVDDPEVRARLLPLRQPEFGVAVVLLAAERGLVVDPADVELAVRDARRAWWERWV